MRILRTPNAPNVRPQGGEVEVRWNADDDADWYFVKVYEKVKGQPPRFRDDLSEMVRGRIVTLPIPVNGTLFAFSLTAHDSSGANVDSAESTRSAFVLG